MIETLLSTLGNIFSTTFGSIERIIVEVTSIDTTMIDILVVSPKSLTTPLSPV